MNLFLPSCSPHAPSDARHFPQCSLLHGLTEMEMEPLPTIPKDRVVDRGLGAGQRTGGTGPPCSSKTDVMATLSAKLPSLLNVYSDWLVKYPKKKHFKVHINREKSMVTSARIEKGLEGEKWEKEGKNILAR